MQQIEFLTKADPNASFRSRPAPPLLAPQLLVRRIASQLLTKHGVQTPKGREHFACVRRQKRLFDTAM